MMDKPHKRLIAWQKSMDLVVMIYDVTKSFPAEEKFGLVSQMRRAAVSAPSNISEGAAGRSNQQFKSFLETAVGSLNEPSTQLELAFRIGYLSEEDHIKAQDLTENV
ncbi:MAG TPA: four helix bundle protein [Pyrinomonadaceae bacterium]|nr:four helix bundle protein [Pyrinomonadaceae bacterium]